MAIILLWEWLSFTRDAAAEIATSALGMGNVRWQRPPGTTLPSDLCGVYIPLMAEGYSVQIGLLGRRDVCASLAKSLLGMGPDEVLTDDADVFDAVGEVTNMVAGGVKVRAAPQISVQLGLPLAHSGTRVPLAGATFEHGLMQMDDNDVWLVVLGAPPAAHRAVRTPGPS
jgi:hypothetical protein